MGVRQKALLRGCAVVSSSLLVVALVAYRAGAWGGSPRAASMPVAASPSPTTEPVVRWPVDQPVLMGGSKSLVLDPRPAKGPLPLELRPWPVPTPLPEHQVIFGGTGALALPPASPPATPPADK